MAYRTRVFFNDTQKAETWDRWQRGESMSSIGRHFERLEPGSPPQIVQIGW